MVELSVITYVLMEKKAVSEILRTFNQNYKVEDIQKI